MIGQTISHYKVVKELGRGAMGVVYMAEDTVLGRRVAIKMMTHPGGDDNRHFRARFLREARAVSTLSHPHIATIHDYGETTEGQPYIVMELVKGETLAELIAKEKLNIGRVLKIVTEVAEALSEAHEHGIVHRDIKPSNVAINQRGEVKVLDFGLAKQIDLGPTNISDPDRQTLLNTQTRDGVVVGTPMYLSPEQARGGDVDARSDLFSLGGVLYECIAGAPPFLGGNHIEICTKVIRDDPPPPSQFNSDVSGELDRITLKALAKKQELRYQTANDLIADLEHVQAIHSHSSGPTVTRLIAPTPETRSTSTLATLSDIFKRPRLSIGYVAAALVFLGVVGFVIWRATRPKPHLPTPEAQRSYERGVEAMRESAFFRASKILQQAIQEDDQFALAHARLAEAWTELDSSDNAKDELIHATDLVPDRSVLPRLEALRLQAITNTVKREFGKAVEDYQAIAASVSGADKAYALVDLGRAYEKNEQLDKAMEAHQQATVLDPKFAPAFFRLGLVLGRRQRFDDAYAALDKAYKLFDMGTEIEGMTQVLLQRGVLLGQQGKLKEARDQLLQALQRSEALENKDKQILVALNLSNTAVMAGDAAEAEKYSSQALEQARASGLESLTMQALIDQGNVYLIKGNFAEAEKRFNEALRFAQLYKGRRSEARAYLSLASLRSQQGDTQSARDFFQRALPFYQEGGYRKEIYALYVLLGRAEVKAGDYDGAQAQFEQLLQLAQQSGDSQSIAWAQEGLGKVFLFRQNFPAALKYYDAGYETVKSMNARVIMGYDATSRAEVLWQLGRTDEARAALNEALAVAEPQGQDPLKDLQAEIHLTKARMALSERKLGDVLSEVEKTITIRGAVSKPTNIEADYLTGLAESLLGRTGEGRKKCEEAVSGARELRTPQLLSSALLAFSESALLAGDPQAALTAAAEAQQQFSAAKQHESEWRALLILSEASAKLNDSSRAQQLVQQAATTLATLEQEWGRESYAGYVGRVDITQMRARLTK